MIEEEKCPQCGRFASPKGKAGGVCSVCGGMNLSTDLSEKLRRDAVPHRGTLIDGLGTASLLFGILSMGLIILGSLIAIGTGWIAIYLASQDLPKLSIGEMDPAGKPGTIRGRSKGLVGLVLGLLFGGYWLMEIVCRWK